MLETAKELEKEFMQVHLYNAVKFHDAALVELFESLAREDSRHFETLDDYYGKKKTPPRSYH
jgi:rubrerythrin